MMRCQGHVLQHGVVTTWLFYRDEIINKLLYIEVTLCYSFLQVPTHPWYTPKGIFTCLG